MTITTRVTIHPHDLRSAQKDASDLLVDGAELLLDSNGDPDEDACRELADEIVDAVVARLTAG